MPITNNSTLGWPSFLFLTNMRVLYTIGRRKGGSSKPLVKSLHMAVAGDRPALSKIPFSLDDRSTPKRQNKNSFKNDGFINLLWSNPEGGGAVKENLF